MMPIGHIPPKAGFRFASRLLIICKRATYGMSRPGEADVDSLSGLISVWLRSAFASFPRCFIPSEHADTTKLDNSLAWTFWGCGEMWVSLNVGALLSSIPLSLSTGLAKTYFVMREGLNFITVILHARNSFS
jgi:hypothetical protein